MSSFTKLKTTRASEEKPSEAENEPRVRHGLFRGVLFALPAALLLWALVIVAFRVLMHHL